MNSSARVDPRRTNKHDSDERGGIAVESGVEIPRSGTPELTKASPDTTASESLTIDTSYSSTLSSSSSPTPPSSELPSSSTTTPRTYESKLLCRPSGKTPKEKAITTLEEMGLTPTCKVDLPVAEERIKEDGILQQAFIRKDNADDYKLLVGTYTKGFFWTYPKERRIAEIKAIMGFKDGIRKRLRRILFSDETDKVLFDDEALEGLILLAASVRLFFVNKRRKRRNHILAVAAFVYVMAVADVMTATAFHVMTSFTSMLLTLVVSYYLFEKRPRVVGRGFPMDEFWYIHPSENCFLVSVCAWYTLMIQLQMPNAVDAKKPIDVARCARHHVITDDAALKKRVLQNGGGSALTLAKNVTGRKGDDDWKVATFLRNQTAQDLEEESSAACDMLETKGFGLVTGFTTTRHFKECENKQDEMKGRPGYWKFDGGVDCEGEFVPLEKDSMFEKDRERLTNLWTEKRQAAKKRRDSQNCIQAKQLVFSTAQNNGTDKSTSEAIKNVDTASHSSRTVRTSHSMVVLGGFNENNKYYFLMLNWWRGLPLVLVSAEYMAACGGRICFLRDPLTEDTKLDRSNALCAENDFPDSGEDVIDVVKSLAHEVCPCCGGECST